MSTTDRRDDPALSEVDPATGLQAKYLVLPMDERAQVLREPVRRTYVHVGTAARPGCHARTTMGLAIAETYARDPHFYGATYCVGCCTHLPVGAAGEFVWASGNETTQHRVGLTSEEQRLIDEAERNV